MKLIECEECGRLFNPWEPSKPGVYELCGACAALRSPHERRVVKAVVVGHDLVIMEADEADEWLEEEEKTRRHKALMRMWATRKKT